MFCRKCGTKLEDGAAFCHNCGTPVEEFEVESRIDEDTVESERESIIDEELPDMETETAVDELLEELPDEEVVEAEEELQQKPERTVDSLRKSEGKGKTNKRLPVILAAAAVLLVLLLVFVPKGKKDDTKTADASAEDQAEETVDWKKAYLDFFEQDKQEIIDCKLLETDALDYPMLVYLADEGSLKYELLYVTKDGTVEPVVCYSNTTEVYYSQDGSVFANFGGDLYEKSFLTWKYDNSTDQFVEVKKGTAILNKEYYEKTYALRYDYTINDEVCEEPEYELYVREITAEVDYELIDLDQDGNRSIEELLGAGKSDKVSDAEEDVELDTDWDRLDSYIEEVVLPAYKKYISENYGSGEVDVYSLICVDSDDNIPELLFDNSGDGRGTVLLSYDGENGIVHESEASCRGYDFMYEPKQNYVVFCYAGNGLENHTIAHLEDHELVVDQTLSCIWIGDDTELKVNEKECSNAVYNETRANALDKRALAEGWNASATIEEAYEEFGHLKFSFFCDEISKFETNGDKLTIQINDGAVLTCTVPDSLEWESGYYGENGLEIYDYWEPNELEEYIDEVRAECEKYGDCDSPGTLCIEIRDEVVVKLYTIFS